MPNRWTEHVKAYAAHHNLSFNDAQKVAGASYPYASNRTARNAEKRIAEETGAAPPTLRVAARAQRSRAEPAAYVPPVAAAPSRPSPPPGRPRIAPPDMASTVRALQKCDVEKAQLLKKYKALKDNVSRKYTEF